MGCLGDSMSLCALLGEGAGADLRGRPLSPLLPLDLQPDDPDPADELADHGDLGLVVALVPLAGQVVVARVEAIVGARGDRPAGGCVLSSVSF